MGKTRAEAVRQFAADSGKATPNTPEVLNQSDVSSLSKLIIDEMLELWATVKTSEDSKNAVIGQINNGASLSQCGYIDNACGKMDQVAAQAGSLADIDYFIDNYTVKKGINSCSIFNLVHAAMVAKQGPPNTAREVGRQLRDGSWPCPSQGTRAEAVRELVGGSDTPEAMTAADVEIISKMVFDEMLELCSTLSSSEKAKADLIDLVTKAEAFPKESYVDDQQGMINQAAQQAESLVNIQCYMMSCAAEKGFNMSAILDVMHAANVAKRDPATGRVEKDADGKVIYPAGWMPPNVEGEVARQFAEGAWRPAAEIVEDEIFVQTPAELVRDFTFEIGKSTPATPEVMSQDAVNFISKMIMDEVVELGATVRSAEDSKKALIDLLRNASPLPQGVFSGEKGQINQVAAQAGALVDIEYYMLNCAARKGFNMSDIFGEVHAANLALRNPATGFYELTEAGEVIKPAGWQPARIEREIARQFVEGSWPCPGQDTSAEAVRAFTSESGKPTPDTPEVLTEGDVQSISKMILEEMLELWATVAPSEESKAALVDMVQGAASLPKRLHGEAQQEQINKVTDQAGVFADIQYYMLHSGAKMGFDMSAIFAVVHAAAMARTAPNVEGEVARQFAAGWRKAPEEVVEKVSQTQAEMVREFAFEAGKSIPDTPEVMDQGEVNFISKMVLEEVLELWASVKSPEDSKKALIDLLNSAASIPQGTFNSEIKQVAAQADALVDIEYYMLTCAAQKGFNLSAIFGEVHASMMAKTVPRVEREVRRQGREGSWPAPDQGSSAEAVREFVAKLGKATPNTPEALAEGDVEFVSKLIVDEILELWATLKSSEESKAALIAMVKEAESCPRESYGDDCLGQVAGQASALADILYYILYCGVKKGFNLSAIFDKVHAANMAQEKADVEGELARQFANGSFDPSTAPRPKKGKGVRTVSPIGNAWKTLEVNDNEKKQIVVPVTEILKFDDPAWQMLARRGLAKDSLMVLTVAQ